MSRYRHTPARHPEPCPWLAQMTSAELEAYEGEHAEWARGEEYRHCQSWGEGCEKRCYRKATQEKYARAQALRERGGGPRKFPFPQGGENRGKRGWCRWCDGEITTSNAQRRGWHDGREGEVDCLYEYRLHTDRSYQIPFLLQRDGIGCVDCGASPGRWALIWRYTPEIHGVAKRPWLCEGATSWVTWGTGLELEHEIPLWLVEHLPPWERRRYFGPSNLKLRCRPCHQRKTAAEAAERAKSDRLRNGPRKRKGRAIPSRHFPDVHRPLRR